MNLFNRLAALAVVLLFSGNLIADDFSEIKERIRSIVPDIAGLAVAETPVPGLKEVRVNNEIIYMSDDGRYLMQGRLVDLETQTDLTESAKSGVRRQLLSELDESDFVSFGSRDSEFNVLVFTDPDCGYCRRLHEQMHDYNDSGIRISYLAFPRAGVGSATYDKMVSVWCAGDRQMAMDVAKAGQTPPPATCDNPVEAQYQLGQSLGVTGTPSMITFNGDMIPGYVPPAQLKERLERLNGSR